MSYAELYCLSAFSLQRGASQARELVETAAQAGYRALAITDECSMAGIVRAHEAAQDAGLHLIIGTEIRLTDGPTLVMLAPDAQAYAELCHMITQARRAADKGSYAISWDELPPLERVLTIWVPSRPCDVSWAVKVRDRFPGRCWIGVTQILAHDDVQHLHALQALGADVGMPVTAVGEVHYHTRGRQRLHDVMTATKIGKPIADAGHALFPNAERHLRPVATLRKLFPPGLLQESVRIAERCTFSLTQLQFRYAEDIVPAGVTASQHLRGLTAAGARRRWGDQTPPAVQALIDKELALVAELGYEHYFLTVADIVSFARDRGILCQGRGSAANSAVCYALGITEVDPARSSMLFERFISRQRAEPPDIDVDFEHQRREEVIQYVYRRYGRERAALAATVITYQPKSALRDVGKALGYSDDLLDALTKTMFWFDQPHTLDDRLRDIGLDITAPRAQLLLTLARELVGFPRHLSQHVGGFVICHDPLHTLVPVENAAMAERTIIQWDKDDLEALKLLKVDLLALGMLTAIRRALDMVGAYRGAPLRLQDIPAEDPETYDMLCRGESTGVFQVESRAQMAMLPRLRPRRFYDLVIQIAIIRPGPIQGDMVHPYLRRRMGKEEVEYPNEALAAVLSRTLGVPLFQEQVMQIAMVAAGFDGGEADLVRRSMAAWQRKGGLDRFKERLLAGMAANGYTPDFAERIFQQILGFGHYGFPESHSASFALITYASAWLKRHEPAAFCAALLNSWPMGFYAPAQLVADAARAGVAFLPVDVLRSDWDCALEPAGADGPAVRLGLRMVRGLPEEAGQRIAGAKAQGPFSDVAELVDRTGINKAAINALARSGALGSLSGTRHEANWAAMGLERLPGMLKGISAREPSAQFREPTEGQDVIEDYRSVGLTLRRHPLLILRPQLDQLKVTSAARLRDLPTGRKARVAGLVTHRQRPGTASGVMFISVEDETGVGNIIVRTKVQEDQRAEVLRAQLMIVEGRVQNEDGVVHVLADKVRDYSHWLGGLAVESRDFH